MFQYDEQEPQPTMTTKKIKQKQKFAQNDDDDYDEMDNYDNSDETLNKNNNINNNNNGFTRKTSTTRYTDSGEVEVIPTQTNQQNNTSTEVKSTPSITASSTAIEVCACVVFLAKTIQTAVSSKLFLVCT
jgi:hypothetical protein